LHNLKTFFIFVSHFKQNTMLKTNSKLYKQRIKAYILSCIDSEDVEIVDTDKIPHLMERFESETRHNIKHYPNTQNRLSNWLAGLPFHFDYESHRVLEVAKQLHGCELTEDDTILENWWNHLAYHILKLAE
jgi:exopolyphosphatase/pppGpp-phosphohydrolase